MRTIITIITIILTFLTVIQAFSQDTGKVEVAEENYIIYSVKEGKIVKPENIVNDLQDHDVLFFGEEHNDSIAHKLQTFLLQLMFESYGDKTALSMEMFDRDIQYIMDEYLNRQIKETYFNKDSRQWSNYKDYRPMVEFAKENGLHVICANAPFRYVSIAGQGGMEALMELSERAKDAMAPLPYKIASGEYAQKLDAMMMHGSSDSETDTSDTKSNKTTAKKHHQPSYDMKPGQSLWDATMAYSVYEYIHEYDGAKVLNLNGKFHTDEGYGIIEQLALYDPEIKPLVISMNGHDKDYPEVDFEKYKHLGDYIIFTNPEIGKSY